MIKENVAVSVGGMYSVCRVRRQLSKQAAARIKKSKDIDAGVRRGLLRGVPYMIIRSLAGDWELGVSGNVALYSRLGALFEGDKPKDGAAEKACVGICSLMYGACIGEGDGQFYDELRGSLVSLMERRQAGEESTRKEEVWSNPT